MKREQSQTHAPRQHSEPNGIVKTDLELQVH